MSEKQKNEPDLLSADERVLLDALTKEILLHQEKAEEAFLKAMEVIGFEKSPFSLDEAMHFDDECHEEFFLSDGKVDMTKYAERIRNDWDRADEIEAIAEQINNLDLDPEELRELVENIKTKK